MSLNIALSYQNSAPQSFKDGMQAAANILDSLIAHFSINGGSTDLADFGQTSDWRDFLNLGRRFVTYPG